jgi:hypothetical protein
MDTPVQNTNYASVTTELKLELLIAIYSKRAITTAITSYS